MACGQQQRNCIPVGIHFDQGHVTKSQPITVLILLSESPAIKITIKLISRGQGSFFGLILGNKGYFWY